MIPRTERPTFRRVALASFVVGFLAATACSGDGAGPARATVRDSAGITITDNVSPDDSVANAWWRIGQPEIDIGSAEATDAYALFRVTDVVRLSDGRIVVANGGSSDVRFFDRAGTHLTTTGRSGEGPGEFKGQLLLARGSADSVFAFDGATRRMSVIAPDGTFARDFQVGMPSRGIRPVDRFADGTWLGLTGPPIDPENLSSMANKVSRQDLILLRIDGSGTTIDTIGVYPGAERIMNVSARNGQIVSIEIGPMPFAKSTTYAAGNDVVHVGTQDAPEFRSWDLDGRLLRIVRTGRPPAAVTERHLDAQFDRMLESMPEAARSRALAEGRGDTPHGETIPPYAAFITDANGNLWVSDYDDPLGVPGRWTVYGTDGGVLARIVLPERFRPYDIGADWILGRELDDLDVEHVRLYRIIRD